jgi:hypothetical protein
MCSKLLEFKHIGQVSFHNYQWGTLFNFNSVLLTATPCRVLNSDLQTNQWASRQYNTVLHFTTVTHLPTVHRRGTADNAVQNWPKYRQTDHIHKRMDRRSPEQNRPPLLEVKAKETWRQKKKNLTRCPAREWLQRGGHKTDYYCRHLLKTNSADTLRHKTLLHCASS